MSLRNRSSSERIGADRSITIAVLGATGVGKSSIISQFLYKKINDEHKETVEDLHRKHLTVCDQNVFLDILDTAGHSDFYGMKNLAFNVSDAFVLVYSMADYRSFHEVTKLRDVILLQRPEVPIVVVANKSDVNSSLDIVERETCEAIVRIDWECGFVQASAKDDSNIGHIFEEILRLISLSKHERFSAAYFRRFSSPGSVNGDSARKGMDAQCHKTK